MWSEKVEQDAALLLTENHHGPRNLPTPYSTTRMKGRQQSKALRNMSQVSAIQIPLHFFGVCFSFCFLTQTYKLPNQPNPPHPHRPTTGACPAPPRDGELEEDMVDMRCVAPVLAVLLKKPHEAVGEKEE